MSKRMKALFARATPTGPARARLRLEALGHRIVPAAVVTPTFNLFTGVLSVEGTDGPDAIDIRQEGGLVSLPGRAIAAGRPAATPFLVNAVGSVAVTRIEVHGLDGGDAVRFQTILAADPAANLGNRVIRCRFDGGAGNDTLTSADGSDTLIGGAGSDSLEGGAGNDTLFGDPAYTGAVTTPRSPVAPTQPLELFRYVYYPAGGATTNVDDLGFVLGQENTTVSGNDVLRGGEGNDILYGGFGIDNLFGDGGDDDLFGMLGTDFLDGDGTTTNAGHDRLFGGHGFDILFGGPGHDRLDGGEDGDWLYGWTGDDHLYGRGGNDIVWGQDGSDYLLGGTGNDDVRGGLGADLLYGEDGNDTLSGGGMDDRSGNQLIGGDGADTLYTYHAQGLGIGTQPIIPRDAIWFTDASDIIHDTRVLERFWG